MSEEKQKQEGSCCQPASGCACSSKKFLFGLLVGLLLAAVAYCVLYGACGNKSKMCPMVIKTPVTQTPTQ